MFADTGLRDFFRQLLAFGATPARLRLFVAGGATVIAGNDPFRIGIRNAEATRGLLLLHGFTRAYSDTGGTTNRTLHLALASGELTLKTPHTESRINLTAELVEDGLPA
jgi:chemotaxis protein CheD